MNSIQHASNLYYTKPQADLARLLCERTGAKKVFFGNSGAEANECAIKAARKYGEIKYGADRKQIITLKESFHGRTLATLAATGQDAFHKYYGPFPEGFVYADPTIEGVEACMNERTCAVMIECIQGESGVNVLDKDFVQAVEKLCRERDIIFICDEVQTGQRQNGTAVRIPGIRRFARHRHHGKGPWRRTSDRRLVCCLKSAQACSATATTALLSAATP